LVLRVQLDVRYTSKGCFCSVFRYFPIPKQILTERVRIRRCIKSKKTDSFKRFAKRNALRKKSICKKECLAQKIDLQKGMPCAKNRFAKRNALRKKSKRKCINRNNLIRNYFIFLFDWCHIPHLPQIRLIKRRHCVHWSIIFVVWYSR